MTLEELYAIARDRKPFPRRSLDLQRIEIAHKALLRYLETTPPGKGLLYGVDTCFGPHAFQSNVDRRELQYTLVHHLNAIPKEREEWLDEEEARAILAARILVLGKGYSGVSLDLIDKLIEVLDTNQNLRIPVRGSLGASGDLIPLSYIALHIQNQGWKWQEKEAIAITNGTSYMTGLVCYQTLQLNRLLKVWKDLLKVQLLTIPVYSDAFHPITAVCRRSEELSKFLEEIQPFLQPKSKQHNHPIQDSYILRGIPILWGSMLDEMKNLQEKLSQELHTVSDNPVYCPEEDRFLETALFYGSSISLFADELNLLMASVANWIERTIQFFLDPAENQSFPLMLSPKPGRYAGFAGLGLYATHLVAEIRRDSHPGSVQSLPGNARNQNIVPMGSLSAIRNRRTLQSLKILSGIYFLILLQSLSWVLENPSSSVQETVRDRVPAQLPEIFQSVWKTWKPFTSDRPPGNDLEVILSHLEKYL